jgi:HD-GYP domain-containing protein (c-di-GMP phosphodiesterase class II)
MSSDRPYRNALSTEEAIEEIRRNVGRQFDPHVARSLAEVLSDRRLLSDEQMEQINGQIGA